MSKTFGIKSVESIKLMNIDGSPLRDLRDNKPEYKKFDKNQTCRELLISSTIPLKWMHDPFFETLGHDASSSMCDRWVWDEDKIQKATDKSVWKAYALVSAYWLNEYEHWLKKEEYEFRKYRREQGEDLDTIKCKPISIETCSSCDKKMVLAPPTEKCKTIWICEDCGETVSHLTVKEMETYFK